jgi:hypothetical protein
MSGGAAGNSEPEGQASPTGGDYAPSVAARLAFYQRAGGIVTPLITTIVAFFIGGLVVFATTGHNPLNTYREIFNGTGLNWLFPWVTGQTRTDASFNLQQTLLLTTTLILTGLAVAFAFRCGLFNIGGQGQYLVGAYFSVWIGSSFAGLSTLPHVVLAVVVAAAAGAAFAAIAGVLKATVGAHEVITTIMLNWIAIWVGQYLFGRGGPLQNSQDVSVPISNDVAHSAKLPVFWGDPDLQGLHVGIFVSLAMLVVFWFVLNRTTGSACAGATSSRWPSRGSSRASPARWTSSDGCSASGFSTSRSRTSASSGSPSRCSGATPPSAWGSRRFSSPASSRARRRGIRRSRTSSGPSSQAT